MGARLDIVAVVPVPVLTIAPGLKVTVHAPAGNPLIATLPVCTAQVGWVIVPGIGAVIEVVVTVPLK